MLSVTDILKLLDQVPIWRTVKALPARIEALEARVAELEAERGQPAAAHLKRCEICGKPMKVVKITEDPHFGIFGHKVRHMACDDGHEISFKWAPEA